MLLCILNYAWFVTNLKCLSFIFYGTKIKALWLPSDDKQSRQNTNSVALSSKCSVYLVNTTVVNMCLFRTIDKRYRRTFDILFSIEGTRSVHQSISIHDMQSGFFGLPAACCYHAGQISCYRFLFRCSALIMLPAQFRLVVLSYESFEVKRGGKNRIHYLSLSIHIIAKKQFEVGVIY